MTLNSRTVACKTRDGCLRSVSRHSTFCEETSKKLALTGAGNLARTVVPDVHNTPAPTGPSSSKQITEGLNGRTGTGPCQLSGRAQKVCRAKGGLGRGYYRRGIQERTGDHP